MSVTVIILTFNEELHIARAIGSVVAFADKVVVVDSGSVDRTVEIATAAGATVLFNPWINYAQQFQWALDNALITSEWVMRLDADELIEDDLAHQIATELSALPSDVAGVNFKRMHVFLGRPIKYGGRYPLILTRIWRHGQGTIEQRWMDEHIVVWGGKTVTFDGGFLDWNLNDLTYFTEKHNKYATREAVDVFFHKYALFADGDVRLSATLSRQALIKRFIKDRVYNRLPFWIGPLGYFLFRYLFQFGFLDGREGLIYHFLQGFWYRFLVGAKLVEYERVISNIRSREDKIVALSKLTGLSL